MKNDLEKINSFIQDHHVLSLATFHTNELNVCSLFYIYSLQMNAFVFASSDTTTHIKQAKENSHVSGNILLETKDITKIQGVQFRGTVKINDNATLEKLYFEAFPHAKTMQPTLWKIQIGYFKMTDNTLGFGQKLIWQDSSL